MVRQHLQRVIDRLAMMDLNAKMPLLLRKYPESPQSASQVGVLACSSSS
jgi:hypothetical protein